MYELSLPLNERASFSIEYFPIPDQPYMPTSQNNEFHEERLRKTSPGLIQHHLHVIISNHCSKNRPRYRFIGRFIVNRVVTDKILASRLIYRYTDILADFQSDDRYFGRFSMKFR
jgi:hypothetical protein